MVELRILGAVDLRNADGDTVRSVLAQRKRVALLAHLALAAPGTLRSRDTLLALFWPEYGPRRARKSLNQAVYYLRRSLGSETVVTRGEELGVDRERLRCDAAAFRAELEEERWEEALDLYRGDLLEGFHVDGCAAFERWLDAERRKLRGRAVGAARRLGASHRTEDRPVEAVRWLRRAAELAPYDEAACRELMEGLVGAGDRTGAVRAYEAFEARLAEELGREPSKGLAELGAALRKPEAPGGEIPLPVTTPGTDPAATSRAAPGGAATADALDASQAPARPPAARRARRWKVGAVGAGAALVLAIVLGFIVDGTGSAAHPALVEDRVVVLEFENRTGDPALETVGRMASDWTAQGLKRTGLVQVLGPVRAEEVPDTDELGEASSGAWRSSVGRETGAATAVWGSLYGDSSALYLQAHVSSVATGELLGGLFPVRIEADAPAEAVDRVAQKVMGLMASRFDPRLAEWAETGPKAPSYDAYREFVAGLQINRAPESVTRWIRAWEMDTTFVEPLLFAADYLSRPSAGRRLPELRDSVWRSVERLEGRLSRDEALRLDAARALRRGDRTGHYRHLRKAAEIAPHLLNPAANAAFVAGRYREAVEILERPDLPRLWVGYPWKRFTAGLHFLGEHERELEAARRAREARPGDLRPMEMTVTALAALGRTTEIEEVLVDVRSVGGDPWFPTEMVLQIGGIELLWHDRPEMARRLLGEADLGFRARLANDPAPDLRRMYRWRRTLGLLYLERFEEARDLARAEVEELPSEPLLGQIRWWGTLGLAAAGAGDRVTLERSLEWLGSVEDFMGQATWLRALIAAQLGDCERAVELLREAIRKGAGHPMIHRRVGLIHCRHHPDLIELARPFG